MWNQKTGEKLKQKNGVSTSWPRDIRGQRLGHVADRCIQRGKTVVHFREMSVILLPLLLYLLILSSSPENVPPEASHFSNIPCPQSTFSYLQLNDYVLNTYISCQTNSSPRAPSAGLTAGSLAQSGA